MTKTGKHIAALSVCLIALFSMPAMRTGGLHAQTLTLQAPATVVQGEQFHIIYTLKNAEGSNFQMPRITNGLKVMFTPVQGTSISSRTVNGVTTTERSQTYKILLKAETSGTFSIGQAEITVGGKTIKARSHTIKVLPPDKYGAGTQQQYSQPAAPPSLNSENVFVEAAISKTRILEQEAFYVTFRVYSTYTMTQVRNVEFPEFEGFITEDLFTATSLQPTLQNYRGHNYQVADLKRYLLFPQRSGAITIPSGKADVVCYIPTGQQYNNGLYSTSIPVQALRTVSTRPITINVLPLPEVKPANFANALGTFSATSSISANRITANSEVKLTLTISGTGNIKLIQAPVINFPSEFEVFDASITEDVKPTGEGLAGKKIIEYTFIPRYEGDFTIPETTFSYYDLKQKAYRQLSVPSYKIKVLRDPNSANNTATSYNSNGAAIRDILPLKTDIQFRKNSDFIAGSTVYFSICCIVPALLALVVFLFHKREKENSNLALQRKRNASKTATKRLKDAYLCMQQNRQSNFYEELGRAVTGYAADKLSIPVAELNRDNLSVQLEQYGATPNTIASLLNVLNCCEFARFAPSQQTAQMSPLYNQAVEIIEELEKVKR